MTDDSTIADIRNGVRTFPADLTAVLAVVALAGVAVYVPAVNESLIRPVVGLWFVLFIPGYALIAAMFPAAGTGAASASEKEDVLETSAEESTAEPKHGQGATRNRRIDDFERVALSFGLSIAIVPLLGLLLAVSPLQFTAAAMFAALTVFILGCTLVAVFRRQALPESARFRVSYRGWLARQTGSEDGTGSRSRFDTVLSVGLIAAALLAVGVLGVATVSPPDGEQFTEFYILTEQDGDELVAAEYPDTLSPDEPETIHVGVENKEHDTVEYTAVVQLQRVSDTDDGGTVTERTELDRFSTTLAHEETWLHEAELTASEGMAGDDLRLTVLLYDGDTPSTPTRDNAYEALHVWVDIEDEAP